MLVLFIRRLIRGIKAGRFISLFFVCMVLSACSSSGKKPVIEVVKNIQSSKPVLLPEHQAAYDQALVYMKSLSFKQAAVIFNRLLVTYSELAGAYVNLAIIEEANGNHEQAISYYNKALEINPNNVDALIQQSLLKQEQGKFKEMERYLLTAEAVDPSNETVQYNLAVLYELYLQDYDEAIDHYKNYVSLSSNEDVETVKRWILLLERK